MKAKSKSILSLHRSLLFYLGISRVPSDHRMWSLKTWIHQSYIAVMMFNMYITVLGLGVQTMLTPLNLLDSAFSISILLYCVDVAVKVTYFISKRDFILDLIDILNSYPWHLLPLRDEYTGTVTIFGKVPSADRFTWIYLIVTLFGGTSAIAFCFLIEKNLALVACWYPFKVSTDLTITIMRLSQTAFGYYLSFFNVMYLGLYFKLSILICAQLEAINTSFRTVTDRALKITKENLNFNYEGSRIKDPLMFQETLHYNMHLGLNECIEEHQKILRIMKNVREFYSPLFLVQFLVAAVVLCFSIFLTLLATEFNYQYASLMHLWGHTLPQIFLYCWYGTKITDLSTNIRSSVYGCDWYNAPKSFKNKVLMIIMRSGREFQLKAGNVLPVSVGTFAKIIHEVGSYMIVMKSLVDKRHEHSHSHPISTGSFNITLHY